ncbi:hypothetical protein [Maribacter sp. Asnod1-A12]|uniref:hypothetical protein n=1 Tax=Maribacter sp. Asnod1-A12 TaxID=3160576 RepID=UPI00386AF983
MKEYISIVYRLQLKLEKENLIDRISKFNKRFLHTNRYIWNVPNSQEFPPKFIHNFYEEILHQLSMVEKVCEKTGNIENINPSSEIENYLSSIEFIDSIENREYHFLKEFRSFGKQMLISEMNQLISKLLKFKQLRINSLINKSKRFGTPILETDSTFNDILFKSEKHSIESFSSNTFNTYIEFQEYFETIYHNYFLYDKGLIECYIEVWNSVNLEKETLENLVLFLKSSNYMLDEKLLEQISIGYDKSLNDEIYPNQNDYNENESNYNDQLDLDQQSPEFWDSLE